MRKKTFYFQLDKDWQQLEDAKSLDSKESLILCFFAPVMAREHKSRFEQLRQHFPQSTIVGCSTSGEIAQDHIRDKSLTCIVMKFEKGSFLTQDIAIQEKQSSHDLGKALAKKFPQDKLKGLLVLCDGMNSNGSEIVSGINEVFEESKEHIVVAGGLAGDGSDFVETFVFDNHQVTNKKLVAVGFYGNDITITHGSKGGWDKFGPKRKITKSEGNILYEIDDQPILDLYEKYLGDKARELPASGLFFPLELSYSDNDKKLVRTILAIDREHKSITFAGDVPEGVHAQFMRANFERVINAAVDAQEQTTKTHDKTPTDQSEENSVTVAISCVGRRLVLGSRADDEIEALHRHAHGGTIIGFYSYGEIAPIEDGSPCDFHNQTMTMMKIHES